MNPYEKILWQKGTKSVMVREHISYNDLASKSQLSKSYVFMLINESNTPSNKAKLTDFYVARISKALGFDSAELIEEGRR